MDFVASGFGSTLPASGWLLPSLVGSDSRGKTAMWQISEFQRAGLARMLEVNVGASGKGLQCGF